MSADFLEKDVVHINSIDRLSGTSSDFSIDFTNQLNPNNVHDSIALLSFTCPKSYYLFSPLNNKFNVVENGVEKPIAITLGTYSRSALITELKTQFQNNLSYTYSISSSKATGHLQFTVSGNGGVQPIFDFDVEDSCYAILGFEPESYTFGANYLESVNVINLNLTNTISLCCDFVRGNNILSSVISNTADFNNITYIEYNPVYASREITNSNVRSGRFYLLDGNTGDPIDLNGLNFSFTFALFKKNDYYSHMLEDKKMELRLQELEHELALVESEQRSNP